MVSGSNNSESELQLCARLLRALAHRIRGDLSVITNDLAYIATIVDPAEVERARARCGRISSGLAHIGALGVYCGKETVSFSWLLQTFGVSDDTEGLSREVQAQVSRGLLEHAVAMLRELVGAWNVTWHADGESDSAMLSLHIRDARDFSEKYSSLGAFAVAQVGERFVVEAGLIDLIVRDHGWVVAVVCEDHRATIQLTIPSVRG